MQSLALELYRLGMVRFGRFRLTSGAESPYYIDLRPLPSYPEVFRKVALRMAALLEGYNYDYIVGVATGGVPLATAVALMAGKPMGYVRPEAKTHGTGRRLEALVEGRRVAIIDDVATTGGSLAATVEAVREGGGEPIIAVVVVDREQGAAERIRGLGVEFVQLLKASQLFAELCAAGIIGEDRYLELLRYVSSSAQGR